MMRSGWFSLARKANRQGPVPVLLFMMTYLCPGLAGSSLYQAYWVGFSCDASCQFISLA